MADEKKKAESIELNEEQMDKVAGGYINDDLPNKPIDDALYLLSDHPVDQDPPEPDPEILYPHPYPHP